MRFESDQRLSFIYIFICLIFIGLFSRIVYMTVIQGEDYYAAAENKVYKKIVLEAPRGEIRDRYGRLLAGSNPSFNVQISQNEIQKDKINDTAALIIKVLKENGEEYIDEFPVILENNEFHFSFDSKIREWKESNNIQQNNNAQESFNIIADNLNNQGIIFLEADDTPADVQKKINDAGYYPPISVNKWKFSEEIKKEEWLLKYKIKETNVTAKETFSLIREFYDIDENISDRNARDIMLVRDILKAKGYFQYEPSVLAMNVSQKTVSTIEEFSMEFPGIAINIAPVRYYPYGAFAAHILGQTGRISSQDEIDRFVSENNYAKTDIIGKTGIEKKYEDKLKGENGYKRVQVDAFGRLINTIDSVSPVSGDTIYLTIDAELQAVAEESLEKTLSLIQSGGTYQSQWGNVSLKGSKRVYSKATSGAVVALDVKTGEVLAMANFPDYDPNIFTSGISASDMENLMPANMNDPLAPKPLYNIATMTSVQPGSVFKMITGLAALESGLDPDYKIKDEGFIEIGGSRFGCWIWNDHRGKHGEENLVSALRDSCNYYFYSISVGYDYAKDKPIPVKMDAEKVLNMSKLFGLDSPTGIQIEEIPGKVPNPDRKLKETKSSLYFAINTKMKDYFTDISNSSQEYEERINKIVNWTEENPSRGELLKRMEDLNVKSDLIAEITDYVKYSFYNQGSWKTGDTFNLAIGQGAHSYTPLQIANYISAIANNGYLNKVTVVDKIESYDKMKVEKIKRESSEIPVKKENLEYLRKGMLDVTDEGTAKQLFANFPVKVAAKTGTAQKSGRIPPADEYQYLLSHLSDFNVNRNAVLQKAEDLENDSDENLPKYRYLKRAIQQLNPNLTDNEINSFKDTYDNFAWFVTYAPAEDPQIAVVSMIFQGGSGGNAGPVTREIIAKYLGLYEDQDTKQPVDFTEQIER